VVKCLFVCAVECSINQRCDWPSDGGTLLEVCGELFVFVCAVECSIEQRCEWP